MQTLSVRTVPNHYGTAWISTASKLVMVNYPVTLALTAVMGITSFISMRAGPFGGPILGIFSSLLIPGIFIISSDYSKYEKSDFMKLFTVFQDRELLNRLIPYVIFVFAYTLFNSLFLAAQPFASFLLGLVFTPLTFFAVPLITFHKMSFRESISPSIDAVVKNIVPLLILLVATIALMIGLTILLVLPLIFYGIPLMYLLYYPVYASVFLGLDIDSLNRELKSNLESTVQPASSSEPPPPPTMG